MIDPSVAPDVLSFVMGTVVPNMLVGLLSVLSVLVGVRYLVDFTRRAVDS